MKSRILKILGIVMTVAMLASFMVAGSPVTAAGKVATINSWESLTLPTTNENTNVILLTQAEDGTIYAAIKHWYFPGVFTITTCTATLDANSAGTFATVNFTATGSWVWDTDFGNGTYNIYIDETDAQLLGTLVVTSGTDTLTLSGTITGSGLVDGTATDNSGSDTLDFGYGSVDVTGLFLVIDLAGNYDTSPTYSMVKSSDGYAWSATCISLSPDEITAIECSDNYSVDKTVYVAVDTESLVVGPSESIIYRCPNAAATSEHPDEFGPIFAVAGGGTNYAAHIYSLDTYYDGNTVWLMAATDLDVFAIPDDRGLTTIWTDMQLSETLGGDFVDTPLGGGVQVFKAMFAPDYAQYGFIWALYLDSEDGASSTATEGYGLISRKTGSTIWGNVVTPEIISSGTNTAKSTCDLEFSADYNSMSNPNLYAALSFWGDNEEDDVYSIECSFYGAHGSITQFDVDPVDRVDFCSLEVNDSVLIASTFDYGSVTDPTYNTQVWYSLNDGVTWELAAKNPTGELDRYTPLLISKYGATKDMAFIGTGGDQSALSISEDNGDTWNQIAFIDDTLESIIDIAFDPTSKSAALITENYDGESSLWKTADVTAVSPQWQRTLCEDYSTIIDEFDLVEYSNDGTVAMLYDMTAEKIYRSSNDLQTFANWKNTATWGYINDWVIYDSATVYAATTTGFWSTAVVGSDLTGVDLYSIAIQTDFDPDNAAKDIIVVGDKTGNAYASLDAGDNFEDGVNIDGSTTNVSVAFDSENVVYFATTDEVYFATNIAADGRFYNVVLGVDVYGVVDMELDDYGMPAIDDLVDIVISSDDTLYVLDGDGDMARYLLYDINWTEWDQARDAVAVSDELFITTGSYTAWTFDTSALKVALLDDTLTSAVSGIAVSNIGPFSATISWNNMTGATDYEIDFYAYDEDLGVYLYDSTLFVSAATGAKTTINTADYSWMFPSLTDATDYKVYVRVNNDEDDVLPTMVELSRWGTSSFTTKYYMDTPKPTNPQQGTDGTTLNPTFGWSSVPNAVSYTFQLSATPDFSTMIENVSVKTTGHTYAGDALTYNTAYYWRVQAVGPDGTVSKWSTYTENYFSITLEEFLAGYDLDDVMGFFRNGDMVFYWTSGAISSFNTILDPDNYADSLTVTQTVPTVTLSITQTNPTYTIPVPEFTVTVPAGQTTVTTITNVVEIPTKDTPAYIWAIVAIGALLTIAVIVLIIRTRRVV